MDRRVVNLLTREDALKALYQFMLQRKAEAINANAGLFSVIANILMIIGNLFKTHANELSVELEADKQNDPLSYKKILNQMITLNDELELLKNYLEWTLKFLTKLKIKIPVLKNEKSTITEPMLREKFSQDKTGFIEYQIVCLGNNCQMISEMLLTIADILKLTLNNYVIDDRTRKYESIKGRVAIDKGKRPKVFQIQSEDSKA